MQILCALQGVPSFRGVYPSDRLPHSDIFGQRPATVIINADPSTEGGSHWLAIHVEPRSSTCFYFDSYGLAPFIPTIQTFLRRTCSVWDYNRTQLQGLTTTVCGHYCTLFAKYTDRGFTPKQFVGLFDARHADRQVRRLFELEFGPLGAGSRGSQCC